MKLRCLASTQGTFYGSTDESLVRETAMHRNVLEMQRDTVYTYPALQHPNKKAYHHGKNTAKQLQWLGDGSSLLSVSEDNGIRVYIASPTLLEDDNDLLIPFTRTFHSSPIITTEVHPDASLYTGSCPVLVSSNDVPLKLLDVLPTGDDGKASVMSIYNTQHSHTERYFKIHSLKFISQTSFVAGMRKSILVFDMGRSGSNRSLNCPGIVSCFEDINSEFAHGGFYAGTFSNWVAMFDDHGTKTIQHKLKTGNGISQIKESQNGKYVFVVTRNSDTIEVLDVRMGLQSVGQLTGSETGSQRLYGDLLPNSQGLLMGTSNGCLKLYEDAEMARDGYQSVVIDNQTSIPSVVVNPKDPSIIAYSLGDRDYDKPELRIASLEL